MKFPAVNSMLSSVEYWTRARVLRMCLCLDGTPYSVALGDEVLIEPLNG